MSIQVISVGEPEAALLEGLAEGQYAEVKAVEVGPAKMAKAISAFANTDGGDLYIGIDELHLAGGVKKRKWRGFDDIEAANGHLQSFEKLFPLGTGFEYDFLTCNDRPGLVLHVQVNRNPAIV